MEGQYWKPAPLVLAPDIPSAWSATQVLPLYSSYIYIQIHIDAHTRTHSLLYGARIVGRRDDAGLSTLIENDKSPYWNGNQLLGNPIRINSVTDRYVFCWYEWESSAFVDQEWRRRSGCGGGVSLQGCGASVPFYFAADLFSLFFFYFVALWKILLFLISFSFTVLIDPRRWE